MLEAFTKNEIVAADTAIPFRNVSIHKGCGETINNSSITLNKCGVYKIDVDASAYAGTGTATSIQLMRDGVLVPQAYSVEGLSTATTPDAATPNSMHFSTLVQVDKNNGPCPCMSGVNVSVISGTAATFVQCNICITKVA